MPLLARTRHRAAQEEKRGGFGELQIQHNMGETVRASHMFATFYTSRTFTKLLFLIVSVCEHVSLMERLKG